MTKNQIEENRNLSEIMKRHLMISLMTLEDFFKDYDYCVKKYKKTDYVVVGNNGNWEIEKEV